MSNLTPHQIKALDSKGNLALTANAGSGKTFVLARKYLNAIIDDALDISNIAAITFTDKAASELYLKISLLINEKISETVERQTKIKLERLRRQLVSANISTIHSFCLSILRDYPVEAKLDARFISIDESLSQEMIELSVEDTIRSAFDNKIDIELVKNLIRFFGSKNKLHNQIVKLIKNRKNVFKIKTFYSYSTNEQISNKFKTDFESEFALIWNSVKQDFLYSFEKINSIVMNEERKNEIANEVKGLLQQLNRNDNAKNIVSLINQLKLSAFTKKLEIKKRDYLKTNLLCGNEIYISKVEEIINDLSDFEFNENENIVNIELAEFGKKILYLFDKALNNYEFKKKSEGYIDYEDILLHTKILLENEDVQNKLGEKFRFIMVDEFQDTNEIQYQIFLPILDYLKKGKLFIVGDEKQSIYKFRDAEIEIFNLTKEDIRKSEGDKNLLSLPDSFRMAPNICVFTNYVFKKLFNKPDERFGEVPSADLVCARNDDVKGKVQFLISNDAEFDNSISESELIARKILEIKNDGKYSFRDIAILVRKRKNFSSLEKTFIKNKIPFNIVGGRGFYQRQVISDINNYLTFLVDPNNSTALTGVLRSPFFTISDAEIYSISLSSGKNFWDKLNQCESSSKYKSICQELNDNIQLSNSLSISQLIEKIITDRNFLSIISQRSDGQQEIANINKLISIARSFNASGFRNLYDFLNYMNDAIKNQSDEAQASIISNYDAVQMMTIHQSKGLEFPIVFVFSTNESGLSTSIKAGEIVVNKKYGVLAKIPLNNNYFDEYVTPSIVKVHNYFEEKKNDAELKRLLYVAVTRAKDELYISSNIDENSKLNKGSFIKLLASGLDNDFQSDVIKIREELKTLNQNDGSFKNYSEFIELNIPIIRTVNLIPIDILEGGIEKLDYEINLKRISNRENGEIISASKISIFSQCPLKYLLTYEYGFGKLNADLKNSFSELSENYFITESIDDDEYFEKLNLDLITYKSKKNRNIDSAKYGRLFHKAVEQSLKLNSINQFVEKELNKSILNVKELESFTKKLKNDLSNIYSSALWKKISDFKNQQNEFEIYVKENDYYLHGIIDKIVLDQSQVKIYDYKTDDIEITDIKKHSEFYLMQLKFYLYIASRLFTEFDSFEGSLIFVKYPDHPVTITFDKTEIQNLEQQITEIISSIRNKITQKNYNHCKVCPYSDSKNNCLIK